MQSTWWQLIYIMWVKFQRLVDVDRRLLAESVSTEILQGHCIQTCVELAVRAPVATQVGTQGQKVAHQSASLL